MPLLKSLALFRRAVATACYQADTRPGPSRSTRPGVTGRKTLAAAARVPVVILALWAPAAHAGGEPGWTGVPSRVLITNDNGIDDLRLVALAEAFADAGAEVWVSAPAENRSGFTNYAPATQTGQFRVRPVELGRGIRAFAVDGSPTDSLVFALAGPMRDHPPVLVVSGINGGANAGEAWIGSGTVGAARMAAAIGLPAIAVSGVPSRPVSHHRLAADWVVQLAQTPVVTELGAPDYLTVSFPEIPLDQVTGVVLVPRANRVADAIAEQTGEEGEWLTWTLRPLGVSDPAVGEDLEVMSRGLIAVVPMQVGDMDRDRLARLGDRADALPIWSPVAAAPGCPLGVSVEDSPSGATVGSLTPDGLAAQAGLRVDDILTHVGGVRLAEAESPIAAMADILAKTSCAASVAVRVERGAETLQMVLIRERR